MRQDLTRRQALVVAFVWAVIGVLGWHLGALTSHFPTAHAASGQTSTINQTVAAAYAQDRQTTYFRATVTSSDSTNMATVIADATNPLFEVGGRQNIPIHARFTNASQSVTLRWLAIYKDPVSGTSYAKELGPSFVLTANGFRDGLSTSRYYSDPYPQDSYAGTHGKLVVVTAPASGSCNIHVGSY